MQEIALIPRGFPPRVIIPFIPTMAELLGPGSCQDVTFRHICDSLIEPDPTNHPSHTVEDSNTQTPKELPSKTIFCQNYLSIIKYWGTKSDYGARPSIYLSKSATD